MQTKQYYEVVSVKDEAPNDAEMYTCKCVYDNDQSHTFLQLAVYIPSQKCWSCEGRTTTVTHWLKPVTGILLQKDEYEGLMLPPLLLPDFKKLRKDCGLTLRQVETDTGISNPYLSQLETGKFKEPSYRIAVTLIHYYHNQALSQLPETIK